MTRQIFNDTLIGKSIAIVSFPHAVHDNLTSFPRYLIQPMGNMHKT
uniref:Uncharacterized protein n=1 Tax=Rhizophora mucronata TaxID=61149 RepID=A0A2P2QV88_RHIMU